MKHGLSKTVTTALLLLLAGCVSQQSSSPAGNDLVSIGFQVGPCHGMCPVYDAAVRVDGTTDFKGHRFTAVTGERHKHNPPDIFAAVREQLSQWQPSSGATAQTSNCGPKATDMQHYTITWTERDGTQSTLDHYAGCFSEDAKALTAALKEMPVLLHIDQWVQPVH